MLPTSSTNPYIHDSQNRTPSLFVGFFSSATDKAQNWGEVQSSTSSNPLSGTMAFPYVRNNSERAVPGPQWNFGMLSYFLFWSRGESRVFGTHTLTTTYWRCRGYGLRFLLDTPIGKFKSQGSLESEGLLSPAPNLVRVWFEKQGLEVWSKKTQNWDTTTLSAIVIWAATTTLHRRSQRWAVVVCHALQFD